MKETELLDNLEKYYEAFMVPLRMGDGFEVGSFTEFCRIIADAREAWSKSDAIPKRAVMIFVDAHSAMVSASYLYDETEREKIDIAADEMCDLIRQSVE